MKNIFQFSAPESGKNPIQRKRTETKKCGICDQILFQFSRARTEIELIYCSHLFDMAQKTGTETKFLFHFSRPKTEIELFNRLPLSLSFQVHYHLSHFSYSTFLQSTTVISLIFLVFPSVPFLYIPPSLSLAPLCPSRLVPPSRFRTFLQARRTSSSCRAQTCANVDCRVLSS
jgi:hypothetical protein